MKISHQRTQPQKCLSNSAGRSAQPSLRVKIMIFVAKGLRIGGHFFAVNGFPDLSWKFFDVFVHPSADHNPGFRPTVLNGIKFDFNSIWTQTMRGLDFQHWANVCTSSNASGVDLSSSRGDVCSRHGQECPTMVSSMSCGPRENCRLRWHCSIECLLEDFRSLRCVDATSLFVLAH